jgi:hypothetical protein
MARITVDVNEEWLAAARDVLGTDTKVATINAALHSFAVRKRATEIVAAFDSVPIDIGDGDRSWGYGGGRDLAHLEDDVREDRTA